MSGAGNGAVEVRMLGPFELLVAGRTARVSPATRCVLARLASQPGSAVATSELCAVLTGDGATAPVGAVRKRVAAARRALGEHADLLRTGRGGYTLAVQPGDVDAARFRLACDDAPSLQRDTAAELAARLSAALAEWRGRALDDVPPTAWSRAEASALEALRAEAQQRLVDAELVVGPSARVLRSLRALYHASPTDARLGLRLALALGDAGNTTEALVILERSRASGGTDLDVDALEQALLLGDAEELRPERWLLTATPAHGRRLPVGVVTFLMTDIEGSTAMWDEHAELMPQVIAQHDSVIARAVDDAGGTLLQSRGEGDSTFSVFGRASDAVAAAVAAQRALAGAPWPDGLAPRVRMGVHSGEVAERGGRYFGSTVNRAARVRGEAHGREIVMSAAAVDLASDHLPVGTTLRLLGERTLRGLRRPERVFFLRWDDAGDTERHVPAATTARVALPPRLTSFVGREHDVDELVETTRVHRLVTVTGPGGAGKTTLALEVARRICDRFGDGVCVVPLSGVSDGRDVASQVASALGLPPPEPGAGEPLDVRVARQLATRRLLLVLDGCEHVVDAVASLCESLVALAPEVSVLATSREGLSTPTEIQYGLMPFEVPAAGSSPEELRASPAVQLFVDRAPGLARVGVDETTIELIATICRQLDGIPLAIELAAARARSLPLAEIAARLDDRFRLLSGGTRTTDARHQTLRATVAWSHQLLTADQQVLFRRLAVLRSPWTVAVAEDVCGDERLDRRDVAALVADLVDRSLVVRHDDGHFRMLETIRQYAAEELDAAGEHEPVGGRNLERMRRLVDEAEPALRTGDQLRWLNVLRDERDDLRAVLTFAEDRPDFVTDGLELAARLGWFWFLGDHEEGRRRLRRLLSLVDSTVPPDVRGRALLAVAMVERPASCVVHPSRPCAEAAASAAPLLLSAGDRRGAAFARVLLAVEGVRGIDTDTALADLASAAEELRAVGDDWGCALVDFVRMEILIHVGDPADAVAHGDRAAEAFARLGDRWGTSAVRGHQGANLLTVGRYDEALVAYEEAVAIAREVGLYNSVQLVSGEIGVARAARNDAVGAEPYLRTASDLAHRYGYRGGAGVAHLGRGHLARHRRDLPQALAEYGEAARLLLDVGSLSGIAAAHTGLGYVHELAGDLTSAEAAHRRALGVARTLREPALLATALEGFAGIAAARGDDARAAVLLGAAIEVRSGRARPASGLDLLEVDRIAATVARRLGDDAYAASLGEGRTASVDALVDELGGVFDPAL